jgi:hypothetical protein
MDTESGERAKGGFLNVTHGGKSKLESLTCWGYVASWQVERHSRLSLKAWLFLWNNASQASRERTRGYWMTERPRRSVEKGKHISDCKIETCETLFLLGERTWCWEKLFELCAVWGTRDTGCDSYTSTFKWWNIHEVCMCKFESQNLFPFKYNRNVYILMWQSGKTMFWYLVVGMSKEYSTWRRDRIDDYQMQRTNDIPRIIWGIECAPRSNLWGSEILPPVFRVHAF